MKHLRIADAYSCKAAVAQSEARHSNAGLGVFAASMLKKSNVVGPLCGMIVYQDLLWRQTTLKVHGSGVLKVHVARFSTYAMQWKMQWRRFDRIAERLRNGNAVRCIPASVCVGPCTNDYGQAI